jgi:hypothetical protein
MAIFNFFSSKSTSNSQTSQGNIIVFDLDLLVSKEVAWDFLNSQEISELWVFTNNKEHPLLKELEQKYLVKVFPLPQDSRQSPFWVLGIVIYEYLQNKENRKITFVAPLPYYEAISEYLKLKNLPVDFLLLEPKIMKPNSSSLPQTSSETKTESKASTKTKSSKRKKEVKIKKLDSNELQKICDAFKEHFELDGIYETKALGEIVKIATGKPVQKVFHTQNAKLYVGCLYHHGIIEKVNENDFKLLKHPTIDIFPSEVKVIPKRIRKKSKKN